MEEIEKEFWKHKAMCDYSEREWEALCDGCGKCCYRKFIIGRGKKKQVKYTRIACFLLNIKTGSCIDYCNRFKRNPECEKLTVKDLNCIDWLPSTCAYRLVRDGKDLPSWHPLISGSRDSVLSSGIMIKDGISEHDVDMNCWEDYIIERS